MFATVTLAPSRQAVWGQTLQMGSLLLKRAAKVGKMPTVSASVSK